MTTIRHTVIPPTVLVAALMIAAHAAHATTPPIVLRSNARILDIRDGDRLLKKIWEIDPAVPLDVYDADRTAAKKIVTFISDIDSISFTVEPQRHYDFVIVLNGRDSCRTRISTMAGSAQRIDKRVTAAPVVIPITITRGKLHLHGSVNGSRLLDLIFDTGSNVNWLHRAALNKGAVMAIDGAATSLGMGGRIEHTTSSANRLEIGGLRWEHEPFMFAERFGDHSEDGIIGYTVFQDKVLEIDYDRMVMIVHDTLPDSAREYSKTRMSFVGPLTAVEVGVGGHVSRASGHFILDTGGGGAMNVNMMFAKANGLPGTFKRIGTSSSRGGGTGTRSNTVVRVPELTLAGFALQNVPIHVETRAAYAETPTHAGTLNMEVLSRFNTILDYRRNTAFFKPNARFRAPFAGNRGFAAWFDALVGRAGQL